MTNWAQELNRTRGAFCVDNKGLVSSIPIPSLKNALLLLSLQHKSLPKTRIGIELEMR